MNVSNRLLLGGTGLFLGLVALYVGTFTGKPELLVDWMLGGVGVLLILLAIIISWGRRVG